MGGSPFFPQVEIQSDTRCQYKCQGQEYDIVRRTVSSNSLAHNKPVPQPKFTRVRCRASALLEAFAFQSVDPDLCLDDRFDRASLCTLGGGSQ